MHRIAFRLLRVLLAVFLWAAFVTTGPISRAQLNQNCTVSILNRNVQVNADGSWVLPNVPANMGQVKARATCVENGVTRSGESAFFTLTENTAVNLPDITLGSASAIPEALTITPASPVLTTAGQTLALVVTARYPDGSTKNLTAASTGTNYTTSNPSIVAVSPGGVVTAVSSGSALIQAINDGAPGMLLVRVTLSSRDSDGDGIADDVELSQGMNPNNPTDAVEDFDRDGLTNAQEISRGTNIRIPDTDADALTDGDEVTRGTNPLVADSDGDLIPDGIEVQTGTNPLNRQSYDLKKATASASLTPASFVLRTTPISPEATQQLGFTANLIDGKTTLDLTAKSTGTTYSSSNRNVCDFGAQDGRVFAVQTGSCTITATNNTLSLTSNGVVQAFTPKALSYVNIPGTAMNVDVSGNYAFVAAGSAGLVVVDVTDRSLARVVANFPMPGSANDVRIVGNYAYVAGGASGLRIVNVTTPTTPVAAGFYDTPGDAQDVFVSGNTAFVADGAQGLQMINVANPASPTLLGSRSVNANVQGVAYDATRQLAVLAAGGSGLYVVNVASPTNPLLVGSLPGGNVRDVELSGNYAFLADMSRSFTSVDLTNPAAPVIRGSTPAVNGGLLEDVAISGNFAFGADIYFVNDVPVIDISAPATPAARFLLPFRDIRDDNATGIAVDNAYVYLTAQTSDSRLYIGQWTIPQDNKGVPPQVSFTSPVDGSRIVAGERITLRVNATDDVGVAAVTFAVNNSLIGSDASAPYTMSYKSAASGSVSLTAVATDYAGNVGSASINVIVGADPLTRVSGRVIDAQGNPVSGARVAVLSAALPTDAIGRFAFDSIPTVSGPISATASKGTLSGLSRSLTPVRGGVTDLGDIVVLGPPQNLFPIEVFRSEGAAHGVAVGDLNADGIPDLAVANYGGVANVSVLLGNGDGRFQDRKTYSMNSDTAYSNNVELVDLNEDGQLDVVTSNSEGAGLSIALGLGDGTLRRGRSYSSFNALRMLRSADMNNDGHQDIVAVSDTNGQVGVYLGVGDGTLASPILAAVGSRPTDVAVADFNGDGFLDVVTPNSQSQTISILLGNGDGSFQPHNTVPAGTGPYSLATGDFNRDGRLDIAVADYAVHAVLVYLGNGNGTFQGPTSIPVGVNPYRIATGDFNSDGFPDITANSGSSHSSIILGNGDGTFQPQREYGAGNNIRSLAVADLNRDGRLDFVLGNWDSMNVSVVLGNGDGTFPSVKKFRAGLGWGAFAMSVDVGDFNGDGVIDVVTSNYEGSAGAVILLGKGDGTFGPRQLIPSSQWISAIRAVDINKDGRLDLVTFAYNSHELAVILGKGDGTFQAPIVTPSQGSINSFSVADLNGDGILDVVAAHTNSAFAMSVYLGSADGRLQPPSWRATVDGTNHVVGTGDFNSDGKMDLFTLHHDGYDSIWLGNGDGTFTKTQFTVIMPFRPNFATFADLNKDGKADLVINSYGGAGVAYWLGNGDGSFQAPRQFQVGDSPHSVTVGDLNGDGWLDIVTPNFRGHDISVLLGNSDGTFQPQRRYFSAQGPADCVIADPNRDGKPDLLCISSSTDLSVLLNQRQ